MSKFRQFLLKLIAGKYIVIINTTINFDEKVIEIKENKKGFIYNCWFENNGQYMIKDREL